MDFFCENNKVYIFPLTFVFGEHIIGVYGQHFITIDQID